MLTSEWEDDDHANFHSSKINTHWHFLQFDNQSSDGVITGFSYEQSVRPFTMMEKKANKGLPPMLLETRSEGSSPSKGTRSRSIGRFSMITRSTTS
jgi:hypothetical protein